MRSGSFSCVLAACWAASGAAAGETLLRIRLDAPLRGDRLGPGAAVRATATAPLADGGRVFIPAGAAVYGNVAGARPVGLGLIRERAWLELKFIEYEFAEGHRRPMSARLHAIENAREEVTATGRIRGIVAASHAHSFVQGIWYQPRPSLLSRSAAGLTGASGKMWSSYSLGPLGAASLFALRWLTLRLPEPEIDLPAGTEMLIAVEALPSDAPWQAANPPDSEAADIGAELSRRPFLVTKPNGRPAKDIVNLAFVGTREQVENAFRSAGWVSADALTRRSFARAYHAFTTMKGYPTAPVSLLLHEGAPPALVFQKSLNTLAKRHHVRIWQAPEFANGDVWIGAATHDVSLAFDRRAMSITHRIDPAVDREREKIADDLSFAGCSAPAALLDRQDAARPQGGIHTDGRLAVLRLLPCGGGAQERTTPPSPPPKSIPARFTRRLALETRHYLVRGNVYSWMVRGLWRIHANAKISAARDRTLADSRALADGSSRGLSSDAAW